MAETGLLFVTGGARSGKSRFALTRAEAACAGNANAVTFIATAEALDDEMADRIGRHQDERNPAWRTVEAPRDLASAVAAARADPDCRVVIVDCLSLWVSNLMLDGVSEADIVAAAGCLALPAIPIGGPGSAKLTIVVTNEVGLGIVPDNALARRYRDILGRVNQTVAAASTEAWLLVSGLPVRLK
jgi:adenosylcobinamide kinase/adenosylcobinamide-phosphate guanylyltransferase